jgi:hypothetical protein
MYSVHRPAPEKRSAFASDGLEEHFPEAAVMIAFASHLLATKSSADSVVICPDGEHAKRFEIVAFLQMLGFHKTTSLGGTQYGGRYVRGKHSIVIDPSSGKGDVSGRVGNRRVLAECKGGIVNTRHPGQKSKLRKGLCELVGQLMQLPLSGDRQIAVCPDHDVTRRLAGKLAPRCALAGIEIALVDVQGNVTYVLTDLKT